MRFLFSILAALTLTFSALAQTPKDVTYVFTEASDLNLIGKIHENTPNPYHRVDTVKYKGFTKGENRQVRSAAGLAVLFKTNSTTISVKTTFGWEYQANNTMHSIVRLIFPSKCSLDGNGCRVGLEEYCQTCCTADLSVLSFCETLVFYSVNSVIGIRGVFMDLSDKVEIGSLCKDICYVFWGLGKRAESKCQGCQD